MDKIEMKISFAPGQPVQVEGPLHDKILCYGMIEMARDAIRDFQPGKIQIVQPATLPGKANGA